MSGAESLMRQTVRKVLAAHDPISVENPVHPGTPDLNCTLGWLELKVIPKLPVRVDSVLRIPHFTPQQRVWLLRRWRADRRAWLLCRVLPTSTWFLFDGRIAQEHIGLVPYNQWARLGRRTDELTTTWLTYEMERRL